MSGESETTEYREVFNDESLEAIGAFSNSNGGLLLIGVKDNGDISGVQVCKKTLEDWSHIIEEVTEPMVQPLIEMHQIEEKSIIAIRVSRVIGSPVSINGKYFKRISKTNQRMSHEEIIQRLLSTSEMSWDSVVERVFSVDELDLEKVDAFISIVRDVGRLIIPEKTSVEEFLKKMRWVQGSHPTRAAILLFGKENRFIFPSAFLKFGRFREEISVDSIEVQGTLIEQLNGAMIWFKDHLETAFFITGKPQKDITLEFPLDATREAIINAICHRDYRSSAHSQIRLYEDSLTISNAGGLPSTLTTAKLLTKHDSIPRNMQITNAFFYAGLIERWGIGTTNIAKILQKVGMPPPEFECEPDRFQITFQKSRFTYQYLKKIGLSDRHIKAIEFIKINGEISNLKYQKVGDISKTTAYRELLELVEKEVLEPTGDKGPGSGYRIKVPKVP